MSYGDNATPEQETQPIFDPALIAVTAERDALKDRLVGIEQRLATAQGTMQAVAASIIEVLSEGDDADADTMKDWVTTLGGKLTHRVWVKLEVEVEMELPIGKDSSDVTYYDFDITYSGDGDITDYSVEVQ